MQAGICAPQNGNSIRDVVKICDYDIGVDFLVYTPQELIEAAKINAFVRDEILAKGKVVYRAAACSPVRLLVAFWT